MVDRELLKRIFEAADSYEKHVSSGTDQQQQSWNTVHGQTHLADAQRAVLDGFVRDMKVLVSSGVWCGDCAQQCPLLARIAECNTGRIDLRFVDRDEHAELGEQIKINAGGRVPVAIFMAEDYEFVSLMGDRPLSRYRAIAKRELGDACPILGAPAPENEPVATLQGWLNEFERVQLLLRLSGRLRQKFDD